MPIKKENKAMVFGFIFLLLSLVLVAFIVVRSLRKHSLKAVMSGDTSFTKRRKIYALRPVNMAGVVVRKFMFSNKRKVLGILLSLSIGGCIFLCTTYMVENLKVHAELSLMSDDGLGSEYRISLKSDSLQDTIPEDVAKKIKNMPETDDVYATKYTMGELQLSRNEFLAEDDWSDYFKYQNQDAYFIQRYNGICNQQQDGTYRIKYNVYGYDEAMIEQLNDFILEGEIQPEEIKNGNQVIVTANMDGQGNYYFYGKKPGDTITLRVPKQENYTDDLLKFQSGQENYIEKEFEIAAIVSRPLAQEEGFLNVEPWNNAQSVIMTNEQMEENFGINNYNFINASPADGSETESVSNQLLQVIRDVPKAVLQDYTSAIETQKNYLNQQQIFFSSIAVILLIEPFIVDMFVNGAEASVYSYCSDFFLVTLPFYPVLGILMVYRTSVQSIGNAFFPFLACIVELFARCFCSTALAFLGYKMIVFSSPFAWIGADFVVVGAYFHLIRIRFKIVNVFIISIYRK